MTEGSPDQTVEAARKVATHLQDLGIDSAIIGGIALAVHNYGRATTDFDLATLSGDPATNFAILKKRLEDEGFSVEVNSPDSADPLGGTVSITSEEIDPVQIVNFYNPQNPNPSPNPGGAAINHARDLSDVSPLKVVSLPFLIALKLYAGDRESERDVRHLLERNPEADREEIRDVCREYELEESFDRVVEDLEG